LGNNASPTNINFNGGVFKALNASNADWITITGNTANILVQTGGATLDTNGYSMGIQQLLQHDTALGATRDGGITKIGAGTLTLSAANTYTGVTTVSAGVLDLVANAGTASATAWSPVTTDGGAYLTGGSLVFDYSATGLTSAATDSFINGLLNSKINAWKPFATIVDNGTTVTVTQMNLNAGDLNHDGTVNITDLGGLLSHYNQTFAAGTNNTWGLGDINGDGTVNITDLGLLLSHYNQVGFGATSAVPEPSTMLLAAAGLIGLLAYAWRKRN
jgi:autotransporter-associated beta strand protein